MPKACDACYHRKVRCDGVEGKVCSRCLANDLECHHDSRRKSKISRIDDQVKSLSHELQRVREQMDAMQRKLDEQPGSSNMATVSQYGPNTSVTKEYRCGGLMAQCSRNEPAHTVMGYTDLPSGNPRQVSLEAGNNDSSSFAPILAANTDNGLCAAVHEAEDDPLLELATMAPLSKMVTDAETVSRPAKVTDWSYQDSPSSNSSRTYTASDNTASNNPFHEDQGCFPGDPVAMGLISESRGRELIEVYYQQSHQSLPILDARFDTWESVRSRSSLLLSTLLFVGLIVEGRGAPAGNEQQDLRSHIMSLAATEILVPSSPSRIGVEGIQALLILSGWGQAGWRFSGHAFRLGLEAQLHRCLPTLKYLDPDSFESHPQDIKTEQAKIVGARLWLAICKMEYEMAFNYCRPLLLGDDPSASLGRRFLQHPMSMVTDARLVSAVELLSGRTRSHLTFWGPVVLSEDSIAEEVKQDNELYERWYSEWNSYYNLIDLPQGSYLRDILMTAKCHATLTTNSRLLHNLATKHVRSLSQAQHGALHKAVHAAWTLLQMATSEAGYGLHFASSNTLTHIGVIFAVRLLIRLVTLAPTDIDLREVGCRIDKFVTVLQQVPGQLSVDRIRQTLLKARRARVLPPRSGTSTPIENTESGFYGDSSAFLTSTLGLAWYPDVNAEPDLRSVGSNAPIDYTNGFDDDLSDLWQIFGS